MNTETTVADHESRRFQATIEKDYPALEALLDDTLTWIHGSGAVDTKQNILDKLKSGALTYHAVEREDQSVRVFGDAALLSGIVNIHATILGEERSLRNRYTDLWIRSAGVWRMVHWQSTPQQH